MFDFLKFRKEEPPTVTPSQLESEQAYLRTSFFSKSQLEEWNPDELVAYKGFDVYRKILRDPQVKAAYNLLINITIQRDWNFRLPNDEPIQEEIREFFEFNLDTLKNTFSQAMRNILLSKAHGFSLTEKIFCAEEWNNKPVWTVKELKMKPYSTFYFDVDEYGNIKAIKQDTGGNRKALDPKKFIHLINYPDIDPVWGESDLRAIYRPWWEKQNILTFWNIYLERTAGGFLTATPKDDSISLSPGEKADFDRVLRNVNQSTAMRIPAGFEVDVKNGINTKAFEEAVAHRDRQIAKGLLVPNLLGFSEQGATGSFAQSKTQLETFLYIINFQAEQLADALNEQMFKQLALLNYGVSEFPRFVFEERTEEQKQEVAKIWFEAIKNGAVTNTPEDEERTRELLGYPAVELEQQPKDETKEDIQKPTDKEVKEDEPEALNAEFIDTQDPVWIQRMNFGDIEQLLDSNEVSFYSDLLNASDALVNKYISDARKSLQLFDKEKANFIQVVDDFDKKTADKEMKKLNKVFKDNLNVNYDDGRQVAQDTLRSAFRLLPKDQQKKVKFSIASGERKATLADNWTVYNFTRNVDLDTAEKFFKDKAFNLTGIFNQERKDAIKAIIMQGLEDNLSTAEIIENMRDQLTDFTKQKIADEQSKKPSDITDEQVSFRLETIVRTNVIDAFNQAMLNVYTDPELDGFVKGLEFSAIMDSRTTQFCRRYDNFKRPLNDPIWNVITPPAHFNCRSTLIPITIVDPDFKESALPKVKNKEGKTEIVQPGKRFGKVTEKNEV